MRFRYCFLDEAQHIKNPNTQNAKAVKRLHTGGYFALTGTPIENTLTELWSIFDFMMPGYLLSHKAFKQRFEAPIVKGRDPHALQDLNRHIAPFILRRMKKDVLQELPDKVEGKMVNEMTAKQAKVYAGYLMQAKKEFATALKAHGFDVISVRIERPNHQNKLSEEQRSHLSETSLDDYNFDYTLYVEEGLEKALESAKEFMKALDEVYE